MRKEPTVHGQYRKHPVHVHRADHHKDSINAGILEPSVDDPTHDKLFHDEPSIRRLVGRFELAALKVTACLHTSTGCR